MRLAALVLFSMMLVSAAAQSTGEHAPNGMPILHDPSTLIRDGDTLYVFSSGKGIPFYASRDLRSWAYGGQVYPKLPHSVVKYAPGNDGLDAWAPDIIKVGETYYLYYAVSRLGQVASAIGLATNTTLDPKNAGYKWIDRGMVVRSDGHEHLNAIDPGVIRAKDGKMWLCYGSYQGTIDLVELNPKTGLQTHPHLLPYHLAMRSRASDIVEHDGWFYLFVNHGSCCSGTESTYYIDVGRSRKITGLYVDRKHQSLLEEPGEPFLATDGGRVGPGHFGLIPDVDGSGEHFSLHYEAEEGTNGKPVLAIRKLSWTADGWPVAGELP